MFVIPNSTDDEPSTTTTMSVDTNIIPPAVRPFLAERDARFEVLWPQLRSLEHQYPPPNILEDAEPLARQQSMFVRRQWWLQKVLFYAQLAKSTHPRLTERLEQRVQPHLEQLMKDLVSYSLDVNIPVRSDAPERRLFDLAVSAIDYYRPIRPPTPTESIFLWLDGLSPLVGPPTDPNRTESESHSDNCDMGREGNEVSWTEEMPPTDPDRTESESHGDICSKNHRDINDGVGIQELLSDDSKGPIDNCDIGRVGDEVTWTEEMPPTDPDRTESESHGDNCDSNRDGDRVGGEERGSDDLEGPE